MKNLLLIIFIGLFISGCTITHGNLTHLEDGTCVDDIRHHKDVDWCIYQLERTKKYLREKEEERLKAEAYNDAIPLHQLCEFYDIYKYQGSMGGMNAVAESLTRRGEDPLLCRKTSSSRPPIIVKEGYKFGDRMRAFFRDRQERREREREHNEYNH
jgi:hypothetical protein